MSGPEQAVLASMGLGKYCKVGASRVQALEAGRWLSMCIRVHCSAGCRPGVKARSCGLVVGSGSEDVSRRPSRAHGHGHGQVRWQLVDSSGVLRIHV